MIIQEDIGNGLVKTTSSIGMLVFGGFPEGLYPEAVDPGYLGRTYVETDIPIEEEIPPRK